MANGIPGGGPDMPATTATPTAPSMSMYDDQPSNPSISARRPRRGFVTRTKVGRPQFMPKSQRKTSR